MKYIPVSLCTATELFHQYFSVHYFFSEMRGLVAITYQATTLELACVSDIVTVNPDWINIHVCYALPLFYDFYELKRNVKLRLVL